MTKEDVVELAKDIVAPVSELTSRYDPEGFARWEDAVKERLLKEFGAMVKWQDVWLQPKSPRFDSE